MKVGLASATTLDSNYTINDTTVTVASTAGWPSDTGVTFAIDVIDSQGVQVAGTYNEYVGTVATGTSISNVDWADGNADRNYTAGATTRVYIPVSKTRENRIVTWGLVHGNQDGTLKTDVAVTTANATLTSPKVVTGVNDTNGNELLKVTATGSAVNELTLANAATGNNPSFTASGGDTNIGINLVPKGTGEVQIAGTPISGAWQSWTPTWASSGTQPAIGNGTLTGAYKQVGKTLFFRIKFVGGSTTTWGTGSYFITLPVAGYSGIAANDGFTLNGYSEDNGVKGYSIVGTRMVDTTKFYVVFMDPAASTISTWAQTAPFTWSTGDYWSATGFYEVA